MGRICVQIVKISITLGSVVFVGFVGFWGGLFCFFLLSNILFSTLISDTFNIAESNEYRVAKVIGTESLPFISMNIYWRFLICFKLMVSVEEKRGNGISPSGHRFGVPYISVYLNFWALHFHLLILSKDKAFSTFSILLRTLVSSWVTCRFESRNNYLMSRWTLGSSWFFESF